MKGFFRGRKKPESIYARAWSFSVVQRVLWFSCLWIVLAGLDLRDVPIATVAVVTATWASLRLLKPNTSQRSFRAIIQLIFFFLYHSIVAGADVARRALDPRLPLRPGLVTYPTRLSRGIRRNIFTTLTSLLPGTVPTGERNGQLIYHCLDIEQPVLAELSAVEAALFRAFYNE